MRSAAPQNLRSGNAARKSIMKFLTSSRPRRGACSEYCRRISGAASSSMILGFQGLPQNPSNQRPTIALLSCSRDIFDPSWCCGERRAAFRRGVSTSWVRVVDTRILRFDSMQAARPRRLRTCPGTPSIRDVKSGGGDRRLAFFGADFVDDLQHALAIGAELHAEFGHDAAVVDHEVARPLPAAGFAVKADLRIRQKLADDIGKVAE